MMFGQIALIIVCLVAGTDVVADNTLDLDTVLDSSIVHYPAIQAAIQQKYRREAELTGALGAFDLTLDQSALLWMDGFYGGKSLDSKFVKPLQNANTTLFAGYRVTGDDFPVYQDELVTNDGGEFNFGFVVSLLRDRAIDQRRFAVHNATIEIEQAELDVMLENVLAQRNAAQAYWRWLAAGRKLRIQRDLVALAETRQAALRTREKAGDVARIFLTENRQNLLRRQAAVVAAARDFANAAVELSLYLRDANGDPIVAEESRLPLTLPDLKGSVDITPDVVSRVLDRRPDLARIDNAAAVERQRLKLAENALLPRVDLGLKAGHDIGDGSASREGFEAIVDLTISIPLERRLGRGAVGAASAKLQALELERLLAEQQLTVEMQKLGNRINAALEFARLTEEEGEQAEIMESAERRRFNAGASDFFLVNLREERTANALLRNLESRFDYYSGLTDFHAATIDLESLRIDVNPHAP